MTRILVLPKYSEKGASSRVRTFQYLPSLERQGLHFDVLPLFADWYLDDLYSKTTTNWMRVGFAYARRLAVRNRVRSYDAVWLEKEALPWLPDWLERLCVSNRTPVVVDYDDAIFHRYDQHGSRYVRAVLGKKVDRIMRRATAVMVGNAYLADRARSASARRIELIPSAVNVDRYHSRGPRQYGLPFTVGWIGTPMTAHFIKGVSNPLSRIASMGGVRFVFVGCPPGLDLGFPYESRPWSEATEATDIASFDCGVMPLVDEPFERGKCGYKLIQYMACGVPVVASPVGINRELVTQGENGYLASCDSEWFEAIRNIQDRPDLAASMGERGRALVENRYCSRVVAGRLHDLLCEVANCP